MQSWLWNLLLRGIACGVLLVCAAEGTAEEFRPKLDKFFVSYCQDCHANGAEEGGLSLDGLENDLNNPATFARWERIYDRVNTGEMPPSDQPQPTAAEKAEFIALLRDPLTRAHAAHKATVFRRLNRREYQNTLNDLFGTHLDLESRLPEDGRSHEFDNVGESLSISMVQLQSYLAAADAVMEVAIAKSTAKPVADTIRANYAETREGEQHIGKSWGQAPDGAVVFFRALGYPSGMLRTARIRESGWYKVRVTGYAYQSEESITFAVGGTSFQRGSERPTFGYYAFKPGKPTTIELTTWINQNYMIEITPWGIRDHDNEIRKNGTSSYRGPGLAINHVELEGPLIDEFPSRGHTLLFKELDRREIEPRNPADKQKSWYVPKFEIVTDNPARDVQPVLKRIAATAFRRPVGDAEVEPYLKLFQGQINEGATLEEALRTAAAAIFCSPDFLYLTETDGWLNDYAIAARLSYFLTRTSPDESLLAAAAAGELSSNPETLRHHTRRLLNDPRSDRFVVDFTDAWLNLRDIEFTMPDRNLFPEFDRFLQYSMLAETRDYFRELIERDLGVRHLVQSDFALLNNRLAEHYDIEKVEGPELRRVTLPTDSVRGGFLTQASVLKVSANGTNTSPVVRGVWVLERLLGQTPPPPPPGVPGVEPDIRGASTLRELLAKHRDVDSCRSCHTMIDPPGFALESFNPIGGWRDHYRSLGEGEKVDIQVEGRNVRYRRGPPVDASGETADGRPFAGYLEFRNHLAADDDLLARTLATKLLTFATGREMGFSDRAGIAEIVQKSKANGHGVRNLIELVVLSQTFRQK